MLKHYPTVLIYSITHFLVDFACAFILFKTVHNSGEFYLFLLIYNFCAFALQMPFGLLADRINKNSVFAAVGCGCVAMAYGFGGIPLIAVLLAGIGNGLFHIGGGIDVLNISTEKASALGIFVSPGALGLFLGTILGKQGTLSTVYVVLALAAAAAVILFASYRIRHTFSSNNVPVSFHGLAHAGILVAAACLFIVVCLRSYVGMTLNFSWKAQSGWALALVFAVVLGKMFGGFLSDWIGSYKASGISLGSAAVLFLFSGYPAAGIAAVFLFNMTMPITLWAIARIMKGSKGFSFGILTFGLFLGFLPVYLEFHAPFSIPVGFSVAAVISLVLLILGLRKAVD